jgi:hypothetical protein
MVFLREEFLIKKSESPPVAEFCKYHAKAWFFEQKKII